MSHEQNLDLRSVWDTLAEEEQEACLYMSVAEWQSGVDNRYFTEMGIEPLIVDQLMEKEIIDAKPAHIFAREFVDRHKEAVEAIRNKERDQRTDDEKSLLTNFEHTQRVAILEDSPLRYRLISQEFYNFARTRFPEE